MVVKMNKKVIIGILIAVLLIVIGLVVAYKVIENGVTNRADFDFKVDNISSAPVETENNEKNYNWSTKVVQLSPIINKEEITPIPTFATAKYNNITYSARRKIISSDNISKCIGNITLTSYGNDVNKQEIYSETAEIFSIKNISEECVIAIRFEGDTSYYSYANSDYKPTTLGKFIEDLNLKEVTSFGTISYSYWDKDTEENINVEFYNVDNNIIWDRLFNNLSSENVYDGSKSPFEYRSEQFGQRASIGVKSPLLGDNGEGIILSDKGYLMTSFLGLGIFYIGEDKVQEFMEYIKENYDGYKIIYDYSNEIEE